MLLDKLTEEAAGVRVANDTGRPGELADVLEVVLAIAGCLGITPVGLEQMRQDEAAERGASARAWSGMATRINAGRTKSATPTPATTSGSPRPSPSPSPTSHPTATSSQSAPQPPARLTIELRPNYGGTSATIYVYGTGCSHEDQIDTFVLGKALEGQPNARTASTRGNIPRIRTVSGPASGETGR